MSKSWEKRADSSAALSTIPPAKWLSSERLAARMARTSFCKAVRGICANPERPTTPTSRHIHGDVQPPDEHLPDAALAHLDAETRNIRDRSAPGQSRAQPARVAPELAETVRAVHQAHQPWTQPKQPLRTIKLKVGPAFRENPSPVSLPKFSCWKE